MAPVIVYIPLMAVHLFQDLGHAHSEMGSFIAVIKFLVRRLPSGVLLDGQCSCSYKMSCEDAMPASLLPSRGMLCLRAIKSLF